MSVEPKAKTKWRRHWLMWISVLAAIGVILFVWAGPSLAVRRYKHVHARPQAPQRGEHARAFMPGLAQVVVPVEKRFLSL